MQFSQKIDFPKERRNLTNYSAHTAGIAGNSWAQFTQTNTTYLSHTTHMRTFAEPAVPSRSKIFYLAANQYVGKKSYDK